MAKLNTLKQYMQPKEEEGQLLLEKFQVVILTYIMLLKVITFVLEPKTFITFSSLTIFKSFTLWFIFNITNSNVIYAEL